MVESKMVCLVKHGPEGCPGYPHPEGYRGLSEEWATKQTEEHVRGVVGVVGTPIADSYRSALAHGWAPKERAAKEAKERRERIATAVLAGFASHFSTHGPASEDLRLGSTQTAELPAISAVAWADALIAELDK
jgi:hypothetical protein